VISVVIPTRERRDVLHRTLSALAEQEAPTEGFEVVVVDNGSADGTQELLGEVAADFPVRLRWLEEPRPGPAAARNRGVEAAEGSVVLFVGDDMVPAANHLVRGHAELHEQRPDPLVAVLGHATWHPGERVTPFMRWLEAGGPQFAYGGLSPGPVPTALHFYTANVSLKRQTFLEAGGFDERFPYAAVEDIELGTRLEDRGVRLFYEPTLVVHHVHPTTLEDSLRRMERVGRSAALYNVLRPDRPLRREFPASRAVSLPRLVEPLARRLRGEAVPRPIRDRALMMLHRAAYERGYARGPASAQEASSA
jgi:glycosyltransferase involved in cell wall biosynthesis